MSGAMPVQIGASAAPSNVTVPIMTASSEHGARQRLPGGQARQRLAQADLARRATVHGEMRENRLK